MNIDTILFKDIDEPGLNTRDVYERRGGYKMLKKALQMDPSAVLDEMLASGVRGRGGAGFAMGKKMSFIPKGNMEKYLVCNADESEPGTFKDRELMQKNPHLLIEGIIIGAYAIGASHSFIFIRGEYDYVADILDGAVAEARAAGFLGENILGSTHTIDLVVHRGAGAYICGEETALLDSLEGKRGNPRLKPPFPAVQGLYRGPTLINNVETLMNVPVILDMGGAEFAKIGTETSTGTKLISISGQIKYPGNYEIELGMPVREILFDLAGGPLDGPHVQGLLPRRLERARAAADRRRARPRLRLRLAGQGRLDARLGRDHRLRRLDLDRRRRLQDRPLLPPRVLRQVLAVPRGHELDREDARADQERRRDPDGPRHHGRRSASRSSAIACACWATRWRCRSAR